VVPCSPTASSVLEGSLRQRPAQRRWRRRCSSSRRSAAPSSPLHPAEFAAFREGLADLGHTYDQLTACLGGAYAEARPTHVASRRCVPLGEGASAAWCAVW